MADSSAEYRFDELATLMVSGINEDGFIRGELSSSALATAVALVALRLGDFENSKTRIDAGLDWLIHSMNEDGGFGDSPGSESNVSTSLLCFAAFSFCAGHRADLPLHLGRIEAYLNSRSVRMASGGLVDSILGFYGKDYTFSVPILSMLVICGVLGEEAIERIPVLPFELALLPAGLYRFFNLQVVSYAIPALVAVGIYLHKHRRRKNLLTFNIRDASVKPAMEKLLRMMPESGGFLEAIPLTAFVLMCLVQSGFRDHKVASAGIRFLLALQRPDGSWPIDTDLSTWVTTLSVKALKERIHIVLSTGLKDKLISHLIKTQYQFTHPFNNAGPGGWGWTSFSGSVPDADDTAGAVLALLQLDKGDKRVRKAVSEGCSWLSKLQNNDGGIPTFCRGWGRLPFDKSCADLTAHAILAWVGAGEAYADHQLKKNVVKALRFLEKQQNEDGSWVPLWFGNQAVKGQANPVYGTARVMSYLNDSIDSPWLEKRLRERILRLLKKSEIYLCDQQNEDGSWGGQKGVHGSMEETSLAVSALSASFPESCRLGLEWLDREYHVNGLTPRPIGLYFASLWYHEKMYPLVFYLEALARMKSL